MYPDRSPPCDAGRWRPNQDLPALVNAPRAVRAVAPNVGVAILGVPVDHADDRWLPPRSSPKGVGELRMAAQEMTVLGLR